MLNLYHNLEMERSIKLKEYKRIMIYNDKMKQKRYKNDIYWYYNFFQNINIITYQTININLHIILIILSKNYNIHVYLLI